MGSSWCGVAPARTDGLEPANSTNDELSIYEMPWGSPPVLVATSQVDANGDLTVTSGSLASQTSFYATYAGDDRYEPGTSSLVSVSVRPIFRVHLRGSYQIHGRLELYHFDPSCPTQERGCPVYLVGLRPALPGQSLVIHVQERVGGAWVDLVSRAFTMDDTGSVGTPFVYPDTSFEGIPMRIRAEFGGDQDHLPAVSVWSGFEVTG